jgi:RIO kinase 1
MKATTTLNFFEEIDDLDAPVVFERIKSSSRNAPSEAAASRHRQPKRRQAAKKTATVETEFIHSQEDSPQADRFTYPAARFEQGWLQEALGPFLDERWITDVLRKVKVGKEASVYLCRPGSQVKVPLLAAKVYRPRMLRTLKNDLLYREGRATLDDDGNTIRDLGMLKAQKKRSMYGEDVRRQSWIAHEYYTLQALHQMGADVPRPFAMAPRAILMDYIGDPSQPAPTLNEVSLGKAEVERVFERILYNLHLLLSDGRVHGDLSAYNVLYWNGMVRVIDFPQVIRVKDNRNAWMIFERDVTRLCEYFNLQGLSIPPRPLAARLWTSHGFRLKQDVDPHLLDANDPLDRKIWGDQ